jgi:hypothetical protein
VHSLLVRRGRVLKETYGQKFITLKIQVPPSVAGQFKTFRKNRGDADGGQGAPGRDKVAGPK